jgi:hypothetical protein
MIPDPGDAPEKQNSIGVFAWSAKERTWEQIDSGLPRTERYRDVAAGDLDGDGNLDLVAMSIDSGGAIYLGNGSGGFRAKGRLAGVHGKGRTTIGDVDGDGKLDIVLAIPATKERPEAGGLRCFLNRPAVWK